MSLNNFYENVTSGVGLSKDTKRTLGFLIACTIIAVVAYAAFPHTPPKEVEVSREIIAKIVSLNDSGNFAAAQAYIEEQITANPKASVLKLYLASSILNEGSIRGKETFAAPKAREILLAAEKEGYKTVFLYDLLGYSYELVNDFDNALSYYNKSLAIDPNSVNTLFSIGHTYWLKGDLDKTKEYYTKAEGTITKRTDNSVIVKVYVAKGRMEADPAKAEAYFLKALPLTTAKAFKAELYANLSHTEYLQRQFSKAVEYANLAIATDKSNELGYLAYARAVISDKDLLKQNIVKVQDYLVSAIFLAPRRAESQYWQGKLSFSLGKSNDALKSYQTALNLIPTDNTLTTTGRDALKADIYLEIAVVYMIQNDTRYVAYIREAYKLNPAKVFLTVDSSPLFKKLRDTLVQGNLFLMAKFKPS